MQEPTRRAAIGLAAAAITSCGTWDRTAREPNICRACQRPIHPETRTVAGDGAVFCCPACAVSEARQGAGSAASLMLTDFNSRKLVRAGDAFIVKGSDVNPCTTHSAAPAAGPMKHPVEVHYDRCSPGLITFASESEAQSFARSHGGSIERWEAINAGLQQ